MDEALTRLLADPDEQQRLAAAARRRHAAEFTWEHVGSQYEDILLRHLPAVAS